MVKNELNGVGFTEIKDATDAKPPAEGQFSDLLNVENLFETRQRDIKFAIQTLIDQRQSIDAEIDALETAGHKLTQFLTSGSSPSATPSLEGKVKKAIAAIRPQDLNYLFNFQPEGSNTGKSEGAKNSAPGSLEKLTQSLTALGTEDALLCVLGYFSRPVPKSIWLQHMIAAGKKPPTIEVARSKLHSNKMIKGHYGTYAITAAGRAHLSSIWEA